jgi:hypothetical protein
MRSWRDAVNAGLRRTTGFQLERARTPAEQAAVRKEARAASSLEATLARLDRVTKRLEKAAPPAAAKKPAAKPAKEFPEDFDEDYREIIRAVRPYTMTSADKLHALITATRYVQRHEIPGDVVECGVWRGGSMQAVARVFDAAADHSRDLYLFDTFEGMSPPSERDRRLNGPSAQSLLDQAGKADSVWAYASLEDVQTGFAQVPYPAERVHYVQGKVEDTVPDRAPERISLLRLDTDWYASTRHEFEHLYPRLVSGGVLIIDDYGWWQGSREATEEFLAATGARLLLVRAGTGRIAVKP